MSVMRSVKWVTTTRTISRTFTDVPEVEHSRIQESIIVAASYNIAAAYLVQRVSRNIG